MTSIESRLTIVETKVASGGGGGTTPTDTWEYIGEKSANSASFGGNGSSNFGDTRYYAFGAEVNNYTNVLVSTSAQNPNNSIPSDAVYIDTRRSGAVSDITVTVQFCNYVNGHYGSMFVSARRQMYYYKGTQRIAYAENANQIYYRGIVNCLSASGSSYGNSSNVKNDPEGKINNARSLYLWGDTR